MKKSISVLTLASLIAVMLAGCSGKSTQNSGTVATDGSTSMEKVIGYLSEAYMEKVTDVKVTYNPTGSGSGIQAVLEGRCDIGLSSRDLKDEEKAELDGTVVAIDGIALIVNSKNPISNLTMKQISKLYKGELKNWSEVGGTDTPVVLIGREAASGTRDGFESITNTEDVCKYSQELTSTGDVVQMVASNPNAIGYASIESVKDTVKMISVEGVSPTIGNIQNNKFNHNLSFWCSNLFENKCLKCKLLPLCSGGCNMERLLGNSPCFINTPLLKHKLKLFLKNYKFN